MTLRHCLAWATCLASAAGCHPHAARSPHPPLVQARDPGLLAMSVEPTAGLVAANATGDLGLDVKITTRALPDAQRPPLDLALVLDTSGSMEGASIDAVRAAATDLVAKLRDGDRISIVAFGSHPQVVLPNTAVSAVTRVTVARAIGQLAARGTTDLTGGLAAGYQQLEAFPLPQGIARLVLLSDGVPNTAQPLPGLLAQIHQQGISITTLGLGDDYDTELMTRIARDTGGAFHYLEKPTEVAAVFDDELVKMTTVVAHDARLVIEPGPGVAVQPMAGLAAVGDGTYVATVGDLAAGETRDLMIPLRVTARGDGATVEIADATLSFEDVVGRSGTQQREAYVGLKASSDTAAVQASLRVGLEVMRVRVATASAILQAMALARAGQIDAARQQLDAQKSAIMAALARQTLPADELQKLLAELDQVAGELAQVVLVRAPVADMADRAAIAPPPAEAPAAVEADLRRAEEGANATVMGR